ncbi:MAG: hypothetical protein IJW96_03740 [Clostridia bacterium]|nr:hypothetical protein [Clostridia bacterium]
MDQTTKKQTEEGLAELYRNVQLAITSIADIMPNLENDELLKDTLMHQYEIYEQFSARAQILARDLEIELKEPNPMKKAMMWSSIKMSTLTDNSRSHIAEMMAQGTVMGITALLRTQRELKGGDERIFKLFEELIKQEEAFEKKWKDLV